MADPTVLPFEKATRNIQRQLTRMSHGARTAGLPPVPLLLQSTKFQKKIGGQRQVHHAFQDSETHYPPDACLLLKIFLPQLPGAITHSQPQRMVHYRVSLRLMEQNRNSKKTRGLLRKSQVTKVGFEISEQRINYSTNGV